MVMNINTAGLAEGLALGHALGLDLSMLREVLSQTGANSQVLKTDGEDMQKRIMPASSPPPTPPKIPASLSSWPKARGYNSLAAATRKQYDRMVDAGLGQLDKSGIAELTFKDRHGA